MYIYASGDPVLSVDSLGLAPKAVCERCSSNSCRLFCKSAVSAYCKIFPVSPACCAIEKDECIGKSGGDPKEMKKCAAKYMACTLKSKLGKKPPQVPNDFPKSGN